MSLPPSFCDLGVDIWTYIMDFLEPLYILRVRQTCRLLRDITNERLVWVSAVQKVAAEHSLSPRAFLIDRMDRQKLEQTVLSPRRFLSLIRARSRGNSSINSYPPVYPESVRVLMNNYTPEQLDALNLSQVDRSYRCSVLFAAGRFLLTIRTAYSKEGDGRRLLYTQLWELGQPALSNRINLMTSLIIDQQGRYESSVVHPMQTHNGVPMYHLIIDTREQDLGATLSVYSISVFDAAPEIRKQNILHFPDGVTCYFTDGSRIAVLNKSGGVSIWDWSDGLAASFHCSLDFSAYVQHDHNLLYGASLVLVEDNFLLSFEGKIHQWRVPPLTGQDNLAHCELLSVSPIWTIEYASKIPVISTYATLDSIITFLSWKPAPETPLYLMIIHGNTLQVYDIVLVPTPPEGTQITQGVQLSLKVEAALDEPLERRLYGWDADVCDGHLVFTSDHQDGNAVYVHAIPMKRQQSSINEEEELQLETPSQLEGESISDATVSATRPQEGRNRSFSSMLLPGLNLEEIRCTYISPWTGRVLHALHNSDILVMDYLKIQDP